MFKKGKKSRIKENVSGDEYIRSTYEHYNRIVDHIDLNKLNNRAMWFLGIIVVVYIIISLFLVIANEGVVTIIIGIFTICITILIALYQIGPIASLNRNFATVETVLFRLIDLKKECKDENLSKDIDKCINKTINKIFPKVCNKNKSSEITKNDASEE